MPSTDLTSIKVVDCHTVFVADSSGPVGLET